jgi:hypothetical protein
MIRVNARWGLVVGACLATGLDACTVTSPSNASADAGTPPAQDSGAAAPVEQAKKALSTTMEGEVALKDGAKISMPRWAVPLDAKGGGIAMEFSIEKTTAPAPVPAGATAASDVYHLEPGHYTFEQAVNVTLPVKGTPNAEDVRVYRIDPTTGKLARFSASYDATANTATAQTYALSSWFAATAPAGAATADGAFKITNTSATDWINACVVSHTLKFAAQDADFPNGTISVAPTGTTGWASTMNWYLPQGTYSICLESQTAGTVSAAPGAPNNRVLTAQLLDNPWTSASPLTTDLPVDMTGAAAGACNCNPQATPAANIFYNGNISGVYNQPTAPTVFATTACNYVSRIVTYHWNDGSGKTPGTIAFHEAGGATYGPWQASGTPGQGGVVDAYWNAYPSIVLPAGTYTFVDSDPATWSQNTGTSGTGMGWVEGVPATCP